MKKILLIPIFILATLLLSINVSGVPNCQGTQSNDQNGCYMNQSVTQTEDIYFNSTWVGNRYVNWNWNGLTWDCNGYKLVGLDKVNPLFTSPWDDVKDNRVVNCEITNFGSVWWLRQPAEAGYVENNFITDSTIWNVDTVMELEGRNHVSYVFGVRNNGIENSTIYDSNIGLHTSGNNFNEDGVQSATFRNNIVTNLSVGVRMGHQQQFIPTAYRTFLNWKIYDNEFHDMRNASVWIRQGSVFNNLADIRDNLFNGTNSGYILQRTIPNITGNTYINGAVGQDGCILPPMANNGNVTLAFLTDSMPLCDGKWNQTQSIGVGVHNAKVYAQTEGSVELVNNIVEAQGTPSTKASVSNAGGQAGSYPDYGEVYNINFTGFEDGIVIASRGQSGSEDSLFGWNVHDNIFTGTGTGTGIWNGIGYDARYEHHYDHVFRDNKFYNLSEGILLQGTSTGVTNDEINWDNIEVSFNEFHNVNLGLDFHYTIDQDQQGDEIIVFNDFYATNNSVPYTGWQWFGNEGFDGSYINNQSDCQYPDLAYIVDGDVTYCSGEYEMLGKTLFPFSNVRIFCQDNTVLIDNPFQTNPAVSFEPKISTVGGEPYYKTVGAHNIEVENCIFSEWQSGFWINWGVSGMNYNIIKNNTVKNSEYGIYSTNSWVSSSTANYWEIYNNLFYNLTDAGINLQASIKLDTLDEGTRFIDWNIHDNTFQDTLYGIHLEGDRSGSACAQYLSGFNITSNYFVDNSDHIRLEHEDPVYCNNDAPLDIRASYNVFGDSTAHHVNNIAPSDQDFSLNNWGTGYQGVIDNLIIDETDNSDYGLITYLPIIGYTYQVGTPFFVDENFEDTDSQQNEDLEFVPITYERAGYDEFRDVDSDRYIWSIARSSSQTRGDIDLTNEANCLDTWCIRADVDSADSDPQYGRVTYLSDRTANFTVNSEIRFDVMYNSEWWDSGGAIIFRDDNDDLILKVDLGITNETHYTTATDSTRCSIFDVTGTAEAGHTANNGTWYSYVFDLSDVSSACPTPYSGILNDMKNIDRIEFVFGGTQHGVIGDIKWYLDNIQVEDVELAELPPNLPPEGSVVLFGEDFGTGIYDFVDETDCLSFPNGANETHITTGVPRQYADYEWTCWDNTTTGDDYKFEKELDTTKIGSIVGWKHNIGGTPQYWTSWATGDSSWDIDATGEDALHFLLTCNMLNQSDAYMYLFWSEFDGAGYPVTNESAMISLVDGGCVYNGTNPYGTSLCCELSDFFTSDCSAGRTFVDFTHKDVSDNCIGFQDDGIFEDLDTFQFMTVQTGSDTNNLYFDDFYIYSTGLIGNNSLPTFLSLNPVPDPQEPAEIVQFVWQVTDSDDPSNETYTAFDCNDDGILDYGWSLRDWSGSFNCIYGSEGTYVGRLWMTDVFHYPTYNTSATDTVDILEGEDEPVQGGDCVGFIAPTCTGDCYYYDDFSYSNPVECNDWDGNANDVNPTASQYSVFNLVGKYYIILDGEDYSEGIIYESMYDTYEIEFDIILSTNEMVQFEILNEGLNEFSAKLRFNNYDMEIYDPAKNTIMAMTQDQQYNIKMSISLINDEIMWYVDDAPVHTGDFYDGGSTSQRQFTLRWFTDNLVDFDFDNFLISYGNLSANATMPDVDIEYTYDSSVFCAVNWSAGATGDRFLEENCVARGYNIEGNLLGLCPIRACLSDIGSAFFNSATRNIFYTIIIVVAFILVAPIFFRRR